ncbi:MAG: class I SAM-dependent RNA methyltransferase [Candidatus Latescibacterota bacterium]
MNDATPTNDTLEPPGELRIESIVAGGDGLARREDGCVVFVPRTIPGELVEVEYTESHKQWRRARVLRWIEQNPVRIDPPCPHYERCGGCQLQHVKYDAQLPLKAALVSDSLKRIGKFEMEPPEIAASPREFAYRNRISLALKPSAGGFTLGYHALDDSSRIVDIDRCTLAEEPINSVLALLRSAWGSLAEHMPQGRELRLTFRVNSKSEAGLAIEGAREFGDPDKLLEAVDGLVSIWLLDRRGDIMHYAGEQTMDEEWGDYVLPLAGTAFIQVNRDAASLIDAYVREQAGDVSGQRIVDAYCGFGLRAFDLAREGAQVAGIDLDRYAITSAKGFALESGLSAQFEGGAVEHALKRYMPADLIILNPPRRGLAAQVMKTLLTGRASRIIYISCDPATRARDIKGLAERFEVESVRAFDLFPQTAHVETVVSLKRYGQYPVAKRSSCV